MSSPSPSPDQTPSIARPDDTRVEAVEQADGGSPIQAEGASPKPDAARALAHDSEAVGNDIPIIDGETYRQHIDLVANVEVAVPFTPAAEHSTIVPSEPVTAFSLHKHRGRKPSLPEIRVMGTGEYRGNAAGVVPELIAVEAVLARIPHDQRREKA